MIRVFFIAALFLFASSEAFAWQDPALPDLAPREVEITGDLTIVFPMLRRQPIIGFNPPPRVPDIPGSYRPFTEAYKQPSADLPPSPLTPPEAPAVSAISARVPVTGVIDVSIGTYMDRSVSADLALISNESTTAILKAKYFGTNGDDLTLGATNVETGRDELSGSLFLDKRTRLLDLSIGGSGFWNSYSLFGATPGLGVISQSTPDRVFSGYEGRFSLATKPGTRISSYTSVTAGVSRIDSDIFDPAVRIDPATERDEGYILLRSGIKIPVGSSSFNLAGTGSSSNLDNGSSPEATVRSGLIEASVYYVYSPEVEFEIGGALFGFDSDAQTATSRAQSLTYFAPILEARYFISESVQLIFGTRPSIDGGLQRDVFASSPYLMDEPILQASLTSLDIKTELQIQSEYFSASASGGWKEMPLYRYPVQSLVPVRGYVRGYSALEYDEIDILYAAADVTIVFHPGLQVGFNVTAQNANLSTSEVDVPYLSPLHFGAFVAAGFLNGDAEIRFNIEHEAARNIDTVALAEAPSVTWGSLEGSYFFNSNYGILAGVRNVGSRAEFWDNYRFETNAIYAGLRYRW